MSKIQQLIDESLVLSDQLEFDQALELCFQAYQLDLNNAQTLLTIGSIYMELDQSHEAIQKSVDVQPTPTAYLSLAQVSEGQQAVSWYLTAVDLLKSSSNTQELSSAYCSLAELYMTDCCFEDDAETKCEEFVALALATAPSNIDAHISLATLRISQQRVEDARLSIMNAIFLFLPLELHSTIGTCVELSEIREMIQALSLTFAHSHLMDASYDQRLTIAKLCVDAGLYRVGIILGECLTVVDDEVLDVWCVLSVCYWLAGMETVHDGLGVDCEHELIINQITSHQLKVESSVNELWQYSLESATEGMKVCEVEKIECEQLTSLINVLETVLVTSSDDLSDYDQQN